MTCWGTSRRGRQIRIHAVGLTIVAGLILPALPAQAAEHRLFADSVPDGAETIWIDIESPDVSLANTGADANFGHGWKAIALKETAFGVAAIIDAEGDQFELRVNSSSGSTADVSMSVAGSGDRLLKVDSRRVRIGESTTNPVPTPSSTPTASDAPDDAEERPTQAPTAGPSARPTSKAPDAGPSAPADEPGQEPAQQPTDSPAAVQTTSPGVNVPVDKADPSLKPTSTEASDRSGLASTGWAPTLLFVGLGLLVLGAGAAVLAGRKKGMHL